MGAGCCVHDDTTATQQGEKAQLEIAKETENSELHVDEIEIVEQGEPKPTFTVSILGARGIRDSDWLPGSGKPDCYCVAMQGGKEIYRTKTIDNSLMPRWAEDFDVFEYNDGAELEFKVWDSDVGGADCLGKVVLTNEQFAVHGLNGEFEMEEAGTNIRAYLSLKIKKQGQDYPLGSATEFEVTVERGEDTSYGLRIDEQGKLDLQVYGIEEGAVQKYNESAKPDMQVKKSDFIMSVNGIKDNCEEIMNQFNQPKIILKLRRAVEFAVILEKGEITTKLGIVVPKPMKNDVIAILKIEDGLLKDYNNKCTNESDRILVLDRIVSVKGWRGSAGELKAKLDMMKGKFQVGLQRPHPGHHNLAPSKV